MFAFPLITIGAPSHYKVLTVFPLSSSPLSYVEFDLSNEAIERGTVVVEEVSSNGSVSELIVENKGDRRILFLEGEELVGAKQNRVLNTSLLIPAQCKLAVPVSCVEHGRWGYKSHKFSSGCRTSSSHLRHALKSSVSDSLHSGSGHRSDQGKVWDEVRKQQAVLGVESETLAMADSFAAYEQEISGYQEHFRYPEGAVGLAIALGDQIVAVDLFNNAGTCSAVWQRILTGFILDAIGMQVDTGVPAADDVAAAISTFSSTSWEKVAQVGDGEEYRSRLGGNRSSSILTLHDSLIHASLIMAR